MSDNTFLKKPSRKELSEQLKTAKFIADCKAKGQKVVYGDGMAYMNSYPGGVSIGVFADLSEVTKEMFGKSKPPEVEYITLDGVTFMTYSGHIIACGYLPKSKTAWATTLNDIINSDIAGLLGSIADKVTGKDGYNIASDAIALLEEAINLGKDPGRNNYDNTISLITNLINLGDEPLGSGTIVDKYAEMCTRGALKSLLDVIGLDFGINNDVVLECAKKKDYDVIIPWEEGAANIKNVTTAQICNAQISKTMWSNWVYESYKDHFSEEDVKRLEEWGGVTLNASEVNRASKAAKHDPLILDLNRNHLYSTTLEDGTHYDYGNDGMKEKTAWAERGDGFLVYDRNGDGIVNNAGELFGDKTLLVQYDIVYFPKYYNTSIDYQF